MNRSSLWGPQERGVAAPSGPEVPEVPVHWLYVPPENVVWLRLEFIGLYSAGIHGSFIQLRLRRKKKKTRRRMFARPPIRGAVPHQEEKELER